jgi:ATP-dependent RNA helicase DeaD
MTIKSEAAATTFADLSLSESTLKTLESLGFHTPTPIQRLAIPEVLAGFDLLAQAQTGTGKTAAFTLPLLNKMTAEKKIQVVILTPTRELAQQVSDEFKRLGAGQRVNVATIIGGKSYSAQLAQLSRAQVLVATPGRLHDLLRSGDVENLQPLAVVLDEADRMLDMGFAEDLKAIFSYLPEERQTLLFSATFAPNVQKLALNIQKSDRKKVKAEANSETNLDIAQSFIVVRGSEKDMALCRWIDYEKPQKAIIFCEMKKDADRLGTALLKKDYPTSILHGDTEQRRREEIMRDFKRSSSAFLVATDLAARGLDVSDVTHVVNFQIPYNQDSYVHRIGRTGRAGKKGTAMSLVTPAEIRVLKRWERATGSQITEQEVPTLTMLRNKFIESLAEDLKTSNLSLEASLAVAELENALPLPEIAARLLQRLMSAQDLSGPEKIGGAPKPIFNREQRGFERKEFRRDERGGGERGGGGYRRSAHGDQRRDRNERNDERGGGFRRDRNERSERNDRGPARSSERSHSGAAPRPSSRGGYGRHAGGGGGKGGHSSGGGRKFSSRAF